MTSTPATTSQTRKSIAENVKDTLESIVVAFILAFVFRAFIVEAFVIPTGSMAVTLYGEQYTNTCSACAYEYAIGRPEGVSGNVSLVCPNCNLSFDRFSAAQLSRPDSGDRILVHKWPFDVGGALLGPHRWDVTVFKDPRDGTTNFIKRLVGLPGEVVQVVDGDVYAIPVSQLDKGLVEQIDQLRRDVYALRSAATRDAQPEFRARYAEIERQLLPLLPKYIQRKLPGRLRAQDSLWFNVYNHDFLPHQSSRISVEGRVGWAPTNAAAAEAWKTDQRELVFASDGAEPLAIHFAGKPITDFYAYNRFLAAGEPALVGDLRLRFVWFPDRGQGGLALRMNRDTDEFTARIGVDGSVSLEGYLPGYDIPGDRVTIGQKKLEPFVPGQAVRVEFINLDYRVALFIDGEEIVASTDEQYRPPVERLARHIEDSARGGITVQPSRVSIAAHELHCRLRHVVLERDVYYRSTTHPEDTVIDAAGNPVRNPYYRWPAWGTSGLPILLREKHADPQTGRVYEAEYFMLGDNSPASKDSRVWWEIGPHLVGLGEEYQVGTVTEDQLIGKAFFVYWPAGYRASWAGNIGAIPNFGRMRWIR